MQKKYLATIIVIFILGLIIGGTTIYYFTKSPIDNNGENINNENTNNVDEEINNSNTLNLPTEGNDTILTTNSDTTLRVVNEYDKAFFTANKNLLIMFASWCPNCQEEISEIEKILKYYKDNKDVNVVVIAHEYDDTVTDLITLLEDDVNFGNIEVKVDLGRVIRKQIDPEASTIPISYVIDKNGNVLAVHNESLTLQKAKEMIEK